MSGGGDQDDGYIVKLRGLPWSATVDDVVKFFSDCTILGGKSGVHMTTSREGRPSGEAFVEFEDEMDIERACQKDRDHMGIRYIEVFRVKRAEMDWVIKRSGPTCGGNEDGCVRLRGLPFGCSKEEIAQFFTGLEIVPNGITLLTDYSGRSSGEAYVQFVNKEVAEKALLKHREKIGHRYIEIFQSSLSEVTSVVGYSNRRLGPTGGLGYNSRPSPYDRSSDRYGGMNRFQPRGSRNFKGANFSNSSGEGLDGFDDCVKPEICSESSGKDAERVFVENPRSLADFSNFDRGTGGPWISGPGSQNGDMHGNRSPYEEMNNWGSPNDRGMGGVHCVHMRGLPFKATQVDIIDFFKPIVPANIRLLKDHTGRASGEADVEFVSHEDAVRAMSKDKGHMQHRYIELFLNSAGNGKGNNGTMVYGGIGRRRN